MRNLKPSIGLCNGTRLLYRGVHPNGRLLHATIISGDDCNLGRDVLLHRVDLCPDEGAFGFNWTRRQFPIKAAFAMSVNKSQGTSICGVILPYDRCSLLWAWQAKLWILLVYS